MQNGNKNRRKESVKKAIFSAKYHYDIGNIRQQNRKISEIILRQSSVDKGFTDSLNSEARSQRSLDFSYSRFLKLSDLFFV